MSRRLGVLLAGTAAVAVPATANASPDFYFWDALCSSGSVVACGSVLIHTIPANGGGNIVQLMIRNLQGVDPRDNTLGSVFNSFQLFLPQSTYVSGVSGLGASGPVLGKEGKVGIKGTPFPTPGQFADGVQGFDGFTFYQLNTLLAQAPGDGIRGCEHGPFGPSGAPVSTVNTCAAQGYTGWATLTTRLVPTPNGFNIAGASFSASGVARNGAAFTINFPSPLVTVTPEPASFVLLGSGLLGIGAFGWVRRRKRGSV